MLRKVVVMFLLAVVFLPSSAQAKFFQFGLNEDEVKNVVKEYLLNNPEIVKEALDNYILKEEEARQKAQLEKLKANQESISSQSLISPISVRLSPAAAGELLANQDMLDSLGFSIEEFGENTLLIRQIPMDLGPEDAASTLESLAADLLNGRRAQADTVRDELLHTVACKAAIKAGWKNDEAELLAVAKAVMSREDLKYCPHGRPICVTLSKKQLEKRRKSAGRPGR